MRKGKVKFRVETLEERDVLDSACKYYGSSGELLRAINYTGKSKANYSCIRNGRTCIYPRFWKGIEKIAEKAERGERNPGANLSLYDERGREVPVKTVI